VKACAAPPAVPFPQRAEVLSCPSARPVQRPVITKSECRRATATVKRVLRAAPSQPGGADGNLNGHPGHHATLSVAPSVQSYELPYHSPDACLKVAGMATRPASFHRPVPATERNQRCGPALSLLNTYGSTRWGVSAASAQINFLSGSVHRAFLRAARRRILIVSHKPIMIAAAARLRGTPDLYQHPHGHELQLPYPSCRLCADVDQVDVFACRL